MTLNYWLNGILLTNMSEWVLCKQNIYKHLLALCVRKERYCDSCPMFWIIFDEETKLLKSIQNDTVARSICGHFRYARMPSNKLYHFITSRPEDLQVTNIAQFKMIKSPLKGIKRILWPRLAQLSISSNCKEADIMAVTKHQTFAKRFENNLLMWGTLKNIVELCISTSKFNIKYKSNDVTLLFCAWANRKWLYCEKRSWNWV